MASRHLPAVGSDSLIARQKCVGRRVAVLGIAAGELHAANRPILRVWSDRRTGEVERRIENIRAMLPRAQSVIDDQRDHDLPRARASAGQDFRPSARSIVRSDSGDRRSCCLHGRDGSSLRPPAPRNDRPRPATCPAKPPTADAALRCAESESPPPARASLPCPDKLPAAPRGRLRIAPAVAAPDSSRAPLRLPERCAATDLVPKTPAAQQHRQPKKSKVPYIPVIISTNDASPRLALPPAVRSRNQQLTLHNPARNFRALSAP